MTDKEFRRPSHSFGTVLFHKYTHISLSVLYIPQAVSFV